MSTGENPAPSPVGGEPSKALESTSGLLAIDPPTGPGGGSGAFDSAIYKNLGGLDATLNEKVRAGYRLIDGQKRDLSKMKSKMAKMESSLDEKNKAIRELYDGVEQIHPLLEHMDGWEEKLQAEGADLVEKIQHFQRKLGMPVEEFNLEKDRAK